MIVSVAENLVVRRPLRDTGKWDRLMLRYASVQLLAIVGFVFVARNKSSLLTNLVRCARGIRVMHIFAGLLILSFIIQNYLFIANPDRTGFYLNNITLDDHYASVAGGQRSASGDVSSSCGCHLSYLCGDDTVRSSFQ